MGLAVGGDGGRGDPLISVLGEPFPGLQESEEGSTQEKYSGHGGSEIPVGHPEAPSREWRVSPRHPTQAFNLGL